MSYKPWMLAAIDQAGYNGIRPEHIRAVAHKIGELGITEVSRQDFADACRRCGVDPDCFGQEELDLLEDYLNR